MTVETGTWRGATAERAREFVTLLSDRFADPTAVSRTAAEVLAAENGGWVPTGLANGHPGLAVFYGQFAESGGRHAAAAHAHLLASMRAVGDHPALGLYLGPASIAFAAQTCGARTGDYASLRSSLLTWAAGNQATRIEAASAPETGVAEGTYDVITGITGVGRILLDALSADEENSPAVESAVLATLRFLVRLSETRDAAGHRVPGWWTAPEQLPLAEERRYYPIGAANTGMAHGIAGPIALLSLAAQRGVLVDGQLDAIGSLCGWLIGNASSDQDGPFWVPRVPPGDRLPEDGVRPRDGWCYGVHGIAAALHRAGTVLDRGAWRELAVTAVRAASSHDALVTDPYLCHGHAGRLQVVHRLAVAEQDGELLALARRIAARLLDFVDFDAPFLVVAPVHDGPGYQVCHRPGLLDGAAGVGCALNALLTGEPGDGNRNWDRMLLLS
ncbi:lanthionine synthetase C family protein [Amycolatopsis sp. CA-230715]|uniref:lanthionine synthetase C family protein n=1 Tax=Amycolatopsis sp. CA-230715 TaxID=2745196 RepID=UPI001C03477F|nr:lanthionine synthetase C family protein [Amycolatopsis sp. CA-230715]QWF82470.1 hypothetical protein HUW46_05907 [Amycolatopsis sp. CA-230715]